MIVECVPNFSEGRRKDVIDEILFPFNDQKGCHLFYARADKDHNRFVVGKRLNSETGIPVYFYVNAALRPKRKNLENIRKGQYEALRLLIPDPERVPDIGEPKLHTTAGAAVVRPRNSLLPSA